MESSSTLPNMPEKFPSIMMDFVEDLNHTFPEYKSLWWIYSKDTTPAGWVDLYHYCLKVYPERFFDILYQNDELFAQDSTHNTFFLPNVDFRKLFLTEGVSESTKSSLWKYLQLILFTIVGGVKDKGQFGEAENLFKGANDEELQSKIAEAVQGLGEFFQSIGSNDNTENDEDAFSGFEHINSKEAQEAMNDLFTKMEQTMNEAMDESTNNETQNEQTQEGTNTKDSTNGASSSSSSQMPNADDLHSHLQGLFDGKIGSLAEELMEELGGDIKDTFGIDPDDDNENIGAMDILKKLMRNPDKMMKIVKKVQGKFQEKMSSGDLSQEDLMKEAGDMLRKMKEMGGSSKQMHEMFQNIAKNMGGMNGGKNMRMDTSKLDRMMKSQETRERMLAKLEKKREEERLAKEAQQQPQEFKYRPQGAEKPERSKLSDAQLADLSKEFDEDIANAAQEKKSKSKSKSKKGKKAKK
jgi:hypothetical protein